MTEFIAVYITTGSEEEAAKIGRVLLDKRLAACVNIVPKIRSLYWWDGGIQDEEEALLIAKTRRELYEKLREAVRENHSYDTPCINALPIEAGVAEYLDWVRNETDKETEQK